MARTLLGRPFGGILITSQSLLHGMLFWEMKSVLRPREGQWNPMCQYMENTQSLSNQSYSVLYELWTIRS